MCLTKNKVYHPHNRPLIAKEDKVCYKLLLPSTTPYHFLTPVVEDAVNIMFHMELQIPYRAKKHSSILFFINHVLGTDNTVTDGFIHTLSVCTPYYRHSLFQCIIPKGTKYF